jgi:pilus assembly protein Flp/PilA
MDIPIGQERTDLAAKARVKSFLIWRLTMKKLVQKFAKDESGATAIEYGLIAALISVVCIAMWRSIGSEMLKKFTTVRDGLK